MAFALIKAGLAAGRAPITHGGVIGQVWRGSSQARIAKLLPACEVRSIDQTLGRRTGVLLGRVRSADVVDGALVLLAADDDMILTSDPEDLSSLAAVAGVHVEIVRM